MDIKACKNYFEKGKREKSIKFGVKEQEKEPKEQTLLDLDRVGFKPQILLQWGLEIEKGVKEKTLLRLRIHTMRKKTWLSQLSLEQYFNIYLEREREIEREGAFIFFII